MADYERKDSNYKAKHGKEPQVLHPTNSAGKPKKQALAIALNVERDNAKGSRKATLEEAYGRYLGKREEE